MCDASFRLSYCSSTLSGYAQAPDPSIVEHDQKNGHENLESFRLYLVQAWHDHLPLMISYSYSEKFKINFLVWFSTSSSKFTAF